MKFLTLLLPALATAASIPTIQQYQEYKCLTLNEFEAKNPSCAKNCEDLALRYGLDGCAPDDFVCHCAHTQKIADIIQPCIDPGASVNATCSLPDLLTFEASVNATCAFFNATGYTDYATCPNLLAEFIKDGDI